MKSARIIIYVLLMFLLVNYVNAMGLAPAKNVVDFQPNLERELSFRIINTQNRNMAVAIYPTGELAEYITFENNIIEISASESQKTVKYTLKLPRELEPGTRSSDILVVQIPNVEKGTNVQLQEQSVVTATVVLTHQLSVNVPYPGKYAVGKLHIAEANVNDNVVFTVSLYNLGKEDIERAKATVIIKGPTNNEIAVFETDPISLKSQDQSKIVGVWKAEVGEGKYYAEVIVDYDGKTFILSNVFNIGNLQIEIDSLSVKNFRLGTIAKFDILLRSRWNERIPGVYANMQVIDKSGNVLADFKTASVDLEPRQTAEIYGYWDTANVEPGEYDVKIILNYLDKVSERLFETVVSFDSIDVTRAITGRVVSSDRKLSDSLLVMIVLILIAINIGWFVYYKRKK